MPSLTTKYEEINGVKKKVFMFRGDEAYAKTVDLKITNSTKIQEINENKEDFINNNINFTYINVIL